MNAMSCSEQNTFHGQTSDRVWFFSELLFQSVAAKKEKEKEKNNKIKKEKEKRMNVNFQEFNEHKFWFLGYPEPLVGASRC